MSTLPDDSGDQSASVRSGEGITMFVANPLQVSVAYDEPTRCVRLLPVRGLPRRALQVAAVAAPDGSQYALEMRRDGSLALRRLTAD